MRVLEYEINRVCSVAASHFIRKRLYSLHEHLPVLHTAIIVVPSSRPRLIDGTYCIAAHLHGKMMRLGIYTGGGGAMRQVFVRHAHLSMVIFSLVARSLTPAVL